MGSHRKRGYIEESRPDIPTIFRRSERLDQLFLFFAFMARCKLTPRKSIVVPITPQEWARRLRCFQRDLGLTLGEFLAKYYAVWEKARDYVTDYEAAEYLIYQLPSDWRVWAHERREDLIFKDSVTHAWRCNFPKLLSHIFSQSIIHGGPPKTDRASSSSPPIESSDHVRSPYIAGGVNEGSYSTSFMLRRGTDSNHEVGEKRTRDGEEHDTKRRCITIPDDEEADHDKYSTE